MARSFNGTSDKAVSASLNLSSFSFLTVAFWGYNNVNSNTDAMFLEFTANAGSTQGGFFIAPKSSGFPGTVELFCRSSTSTVSTGADKTFPQPSAATWHHYAIAFNLTVSGSAKVAAAYVDGTAQTLTSRVGTDTTTNGFFANSTLNVACRAGSSLFNACSMAEIGLFFGTSRNLTALEVSALAQGIRVVEVGRDMTIRWWPIDGLASPEPDLSGFATNLTLTGTAQVFGPPVGSFTMAAR